MLTRGTDLPYTVVHTCRTPWTTDAVHPPWVNLLYTSVGQMAVHRPCSSGRPGQNWPFWPPGPNRYGQSVVPAPQLRIGATLVRSGHNGVKARLNRQATGENTDRLAVRGTSVDHRQL